MKLLNKIFGRKPKAYTPLATISLADFTIEVWKDGSGVSLIDKRPTTMKVWEEFEDASRIDIGVQEAPSYDEQSDPREFGERLCIVSFSRYNGVHPPTMEGLATALDRLNDHAAYLMREKEKLTMK